MKGYANVLYRIFTNVAIYCVNNMLAAIIPAAFNYQYY